MDFGKMQIVNLLAAANGYSRVLEIATRTTGLEFSELDLSLFGTARRLIYNLQGLSGSGPEDFQSETLQITDCIRQMEREKLSFDIVLVDPYHDYACSSRDISLAYSLLAPGGSVVVHDCLPPANGDLINPSFVPGVWCGVTFIAFIDFVMNVGPKYLTVDCDYGCGIIRKIAGDVAPNADLKAQWKSVRDNAEEAFSFLSRNRQALLNLQSPYDFLKSTVLDVTGRHRRSFSPRQLLSRGSAGQRGQG